ncbi:MAG: hypothetical protein Q8Q13_00490, partial [bacterium]|nr:hypothetical protein [bacterium]
MAKKQGISETKRNNHLRQTSNGVNNGSSKGWNRPSWAIHIMVQSCPARASRGATIVPIRGRNRCIKLLTLLIVFLGSIYDSFTIGEIGARFAHESVGSFRVISAGY